MSKDYSIKGHGSQAENPTCENVFKYVKMSKKGFRWYKDCISRTVVTTCDWAGLIRHRNRHSAAVPSTLFPSATTSLATNTN